MGADRPKTTSRDSPQAGSASVVLIRRKLLGTDLMRVPLGDIVQFEFRPPAQGECIAIGSGQHVADHFAAHVGEAEIAPLEPVRQPRVVQSQQVQDRGLQVVRMDRLFDAEPSPDRRSRRK